MNNGIEKLQKYAFGMSPRRCDDILLLADQIKREHASELQAIEAEMDKRLMPPGMEWPKDRNENPFDPRKLYDSGCGAVDFVRIGFVNGEQWASVVSHDGNDLLPEELGDCEPEVLGADGLPIKVGETLWYVGEPLVRGTVEAVGEGEVMLAGDGVYAPLDLTHTQPDLKLRKCPFCGGEADMVDEGSECSPDRFWACCPNPSCFVEGTGVYATEEEAAQAWNTRGGVGLRGDF